MNNRGIVSDAGPLTGSGIACVRATDLVGPEVLLVQEQDPEGYWKIFSIDLYPIGHDDTLDTEGDRKYHKRDETFRQNYRHRAKVVTLAQHTRVPPPQPTACLNHADVQPPCPISMSIAQSMTNEFLREMTSWTFTQFCDFFWIYRDEERRLSKTGKHGEVPVFTQIVARMRSAQQSNVADAKASSADAKASSAEAKPNVDAKPSSTTDAKPSSATDAKPIVGRGAKPIVSRINPDKNVDAALWSEFVQYGRRLLKEGGTKCQLRWGLPKGETDALPKGGFEDLRVTAARELQEEADLRVDPKHLRTDLYIRHGYTRIFLATSGFKQDGPRVR